MPYETELESFPISELHRLWASLWSQEPPPRMGRRMLEKSIQHKQREQAGQGLTAQQQKRLAKLVQQYQCNPSSFEKGRVLKPGTRLVRQYNGKKHVVTILENGFEYQGQQWSSLSKIATHVTGKSWNGWVFFGLV